MQFNTDKQTEDRYRNGSVNWGSIAVHPADLFEAYRELAEDRAQFVSTSQGGRSTRTTALAYAILARDALLSRGYDHAEVTTILASVVSDKAPVEEEVLEITTDFDFDDEEDSSDEKLTSFANAIIAAAEALKG
jgi:hypothetical protein